MDILKIDDLSITIPSARGDLEVVDHIFLNVGEREILGVVGETGSGKTLTAMTALGLHPTGARIRGRVTAGGIDVVPVTTATSETVRGKVVAVVLQNPSTSLNPVFTVGEQLAELLRTHQGIRKETDLRLLARQYFEEVELPRPETLYDSYPHELSGGMQQRALIALALACRPQLLVADEPTTALDVTTQAQILRMLHRVRDEHKMAILWITHDLSVVAQVADRIAVLYAGALVEIGSTRDVLGAPKHPYTQALIASLPTRGRTVRDLVGLAGDVPSPLARPPGCPFQPRCPKAFHRCPTIMPPLYTVAPGHSAACLLLDPQLQRQQEVG